MNLNCCEASGGQRAEPKIRITGGHAVLIDPIDSIKDLSAIAGKFARIVDAGPTATVAKLATAVGDLSASVMSNSDSREDFAEEVAGVMVAAMVAASNYGVTGSQVERALQRVIAHETGKAITAQITGMLEARGATDLLN